MKHFVKDSYFEVVADVSNTWLQVKNIPDFKKVVGVELFTRMLKIAPTAWDVFPWSHGLKEGDDLAENTRFVMFARKFVSMLDLAIDMLGPDLEMVEGQLQQLGIRHIRYGVMPKHYPLMGKALLNTLEHLLGDRFDEKRHDSWNAIYTFMSVTMMQGAFQELVRVYEEKINESEQITPVTKSQDESGELKPRKSSTSSSQPNGAKKAIMPRQEEDTSLGSSLDEMNSLASGGKKNEEQANNSGTPNSTRRSLFSSSEFVKRFTRRSKGWS